MLTYLYEFHIFALNFLPYFNKLYILMISYRYIFINNLNFVFLLNLILMSNRKIEINIDDKIIYKELYLLLLYLKFWIS